MNILTTAKDQSLLIEKRASIYWWFATLFAQELDEQHFIKYLTGEGADFLAQLSEQSELQPAVGKIQQALLALQAMPHSHLELAVEFTQLFLSTVKQSALPYASVYESSDELMFQKPHDEMIALLEQHGMAVDREFKEPADHLSIQLDLFANKVISSLASLEDSTALYEHNYGQKQYIDQVLMTWLPKFSARAKEKIKPKLVLETSITSGFYPALIELLLTFVALDTAMLEAEFV